MSENPDRRSDDLTKVYVWSDARVGEALFKDGRLLFSREDWERFGDTSDSLMGAPVCFADRDAETGAELLAHFGEMARSPNRKPVPLELLVEHGGPIAPFYRRIRK